MEEAVAKVWKNVLGVSNLGLHDNFFDAGANSLIVVKTLAQLREEFDPNLQLTDVFRFPTVAKLTKHLRCQKTETKNPGADRALARKSSAKRRRMGAVR